MHILSSLVSVLAMLGIAGFLGGLVLHRLRAGVLSLGAAAAAAFLLMAAACLPHHYERAGQSPYLLDTSTGKLCANVSPNPFLAAGDPVNRRDVSLVPGDAASYRASGAVAYPACGE